MKEIQTIVAAYRELLRNESELVALATVVSVKGSVYRRPGARMLISTQGHSLGAISGGCLEGDVVERASQVMTSGQPQLVVYDTTSDGDTVWGLGMGCNGEVQVLIEPVSAGTDPHPIKMLETLLSESAPLVWAMVVKTTDLNSVSVGSHLLLRSDESVESSIPNQALAKLLVADAGQVFRHQKSELKEYLVEGVATEVFLEFLESPQPLVIFGAGYDALPLVALGKELGWQVSVIDHRPAFARAERFPLANQVIQSHPENISNHVKLTPRTVAVVMTHNYQRDGEILKALLPFPLPYIGMLGPKRRTDALLNDLQGAGFEITPDQRQRIFGPVGLDIGAETPEEIALSIIAEIRAVISGHQAGFLRQRMGPIH
ncbi:MAG: XdhC family protein [Acidobacteria bacterium]|nr:XdhC family protein [Acidobacteriota bacterium]